MINKLYVYTINSTNPYINLAAEQLLFDTAAKGTMIMYLWQNQNTVVIGKNQNTWAECDCSLAESEGVRVARRLSGGGAVFHDLGNLNFTFISSSADYDLAKNMQIIKKACEFSGISAELSGRNDILAQGRKFSGNAFYNSRGRSYHHGTIMINADRNKMTRYLTPSGAKLEAKGVKSVRSRVVNLAEINPELTVDIMKANLIKAFEEVYELKGEITEVKINEDLILLSHSYESRDFIYGMQPPFSCFFEGQFAWGGIRINLDVKKGLVENAAVYTDSMDWTLAGILKSALEGQRFDGLSLAGADLDEGVKRDIVKMIKK